MELNVTPTSAPRRFTNHDAAESFRIVISTLPVGVAAAPSLLGSRRLTTCNSTVVASGC